MIKHIVLTIAGFSLLALGIVGAAMPVLPTTPFVIASAVCLTGSNNKVSGWLEQSPFFGNFIQHYKTKRGVPKKSKIVSIAVLWAGLATAMALTTNEWLYLVLPIVGAAVTIHIVTIRPRRSNVSQSGATTKT